MAKHSTIPKVLFAGIYMLMFLYHFCPAQQSTPDKQNSKAVLIVYHMGRITDKQSPPLDQTAVDALTQSTTKEVNVEKVAQSISDQLTVMGYRVDLIRVTDITDPRKFLEYEGIIIGTPTWFSNVAYPVKELIDEQLHRIYQNRKEKLNDKVLSGFTTAMSRGEDGPDCLRALTKSMNHLSKQVVEGLVINAGDNADTVNAQVQHFCDRFVQILK